MRNVVVLPQPDGPTSVTNSRSAISMLRSCTAVTGPNLLTTCSSTTLATVVSDGAFYDAQARDERRRPDGAEALRVSGRWEGGLEEGFDLLAGRQRGDRPIARGGNRPDRVRETERRHEQGLVIDDAPIGLRREASQQSGDEGVAGAKAIHCFHPDS